MSTGSEGESLAPAQEGEVREVSESDLGSGDVRVPGETEIVYRAPDQRVPPVQVVRGREIEIRGSAAQLVQGILQDWVEAQYRRVEFLGRDGQGDRDTRAQIRKILEGTRTVQAILHAWEGALALPQENRDIPNPDN